MQTIYLSDDGVEFNNKEACLKHEKSGELGILVINDDFNQDVFLEYCGFPQDSFTEYGIYRFNSNEFESNILFIPSEEALEGLQKHLRRIDFIDTSINSLKVGINISDSGISQYYSIDEIRKTLDNIENAFPSIG